MRQSLRSHLSELLRLAAPVVVARAGILTMSTADIVMVGHFSAGELGYYGIGVAPFIVVMVVGIGLLTGTLVMTSHTRGAGRAADCGAVWRRSLPYAALIGLAGTLLCLFGEPVLRLLGQTPDIARGGGRVMALAGLGLLPTMIYVNSVFFLEGLGRPLPGMIVIVAGNLLNLLLNGVLIFGPYGLPALGADGAILATSIVRLVMAVALAAHVWWMPSRDLFGVRTRLSAGWWRDGREQWRLGYAAGISQGVETTAFNSLTLMAGVLGPLALASYSVALNVTALIFMLALGFGAATAVRVGAARGAGDLQGMQAAGWVGLLATALPMAVFGVLLFLWPNQIGGLYSNQEDLRAILPSLMVIVALVLVPDGGQVVMAYALRGAGDAWVPTALHLTSYFVVMIPAAWLLAFPLGHGVHGLIEAIALASAFSVSVLMIRFWLIGRARN